MPPAICDSEDEDEILVDDGPSQRSTFSAHAAHAEAILEGFPSYDGANDQQPASTTSSELRRQIQSAERNLFTAASAQPSMSTPAIGASTSPVLRKDDRRRTTVVGSELVASPPKSARSTKTTNAKTYGKSNRTFAAEDLVDFAALCGDASAPKTSQSARFSDHSGVPNQSSGLPPGTIQEEFMNHEPQVMFKDTGSTVAFNESSQQRLLEQALNAEDPAATAQAQEKSSASAQTKQSSSFPWSVSAGPTQSPKTNGPKAQPDNAPDYENAEDTITVAPKQTLIDPPGSNVTNEAGDPSKKQTDSTEDETGLNVSNEALQRSAQARLLKSSPVVEIPRYEPSQNDDTGTAEMQKPTRGRKRKADNDVEESLNSDDKAIGLPKENYQPRPSRRRATAALEAPIDYSVIPEKAAKKRRKTAEANLSVPNSHPKEGQAPGHEQNKAPETTPPETDVDELAGATNEKADKGGMLTSKPSDPIPSSPKASQKSNTESASPDKGSLSTKKAKDAMLMKPPSVPASASRKTRRSHTTIFEDHIDLSRSQKSPSLSQQQASRKSALKEVPNESVSDKRKKRRTIVQDDDDDEDELAKEPSDEEDVVPKKRGRPAKAKPTKTKSKERVLEDSEEEEVELELEEEEPPKTKGRGRPKKAKTDEVSTEQELVKEPETATSSEIPADTSSDMPGQSSPTKAALERKDANAKLQVNAASDKSTDSSERSAQPASKELLSPKKTPAKASPTTTHSPIKGSSFANYRVGLSKRSRIPSLLKSFRAPAPARR